MNINANVQAAVIAKQRERRRNHTALGKLPKMSVDLQNAAGNRSPDRMPLNVNINLIGLYFCYSKRRFRYANVEAPVCQFHRADRTARSQALPDFEQIFALG